MAFIFFVALLYFQCLGLPAVTGENRNAWPPNLISTAIIVFLPQQYMQPRSYSVALDREEHVQQLYDGKR